MTPYFTTPGTYFSRCREYRWTLWREWLEDAFWTSPISSRGQSFVQFVCLNPSTADEVTNDRTLSKCITLARAWGFGAVCVTNIFALRSTDPAALYKSEDPRGVENLQWIKAVASRAGLIVAAWGNHGEHLTQGENIAGVLKCYFPEKLATLATAAGAPLINQTGHPAHPLYQRKDSTFLKWEGMP